MNNYSEDEIDINNQFPSQYRIDDQYFKTHSIPRVREYITNREYIIITFDTNQIFRGTFDYWNDVDEIEEYIDTTYENMPYREDCDSYTNMYFTCNNKKYVFNECDYYYDAHLFICQIKRNANAAREQMEERALDKIFKKVVNEDFQWSSLV